MASIYKLIEASAFYYSKEVGRFHVKTDRTSIQSESYMLFENEPFLVLVLGMDLYRKLINEIMEMPQYFMNNNGRAGLTDIRIGGVYIKIFKDMDNNDTFSLSIQKFIIKP